MLGFGEGCDATYCCYLCGCPPYPSLCTCILSNIVTDNRAALRFNHGFKAEPCSDCCVMFWWAGLAGCALTGGVVWLCSFEDGNASRVRGLTR